MIELSQFVLAQYIVHNEAREPGEGEECTNQDGSVGHHPDFDTTNPIQLVQDQYVDHDIDQKGDDTKEYGGGQGYPLSDSSVVFKVEVTHMEGTVVGDGLEHRVRMICIYLTKDKDEEEERRYPATGYQDLLLQCVSPFSVPEDK